jgi:hypothetical protein
LIRLIRFFDGLFGHAHFPARPGNAHGRTIEPIVVRHSLTDIFARCTASREQCDAEESIEQSKQSNNRNNRINRTIESIEQSNQSFNRFIFAA